jgi:hypothetical protein
MATKYVVTLINGRGDQFWLRSTVWTSNAERADVFETRDLARAAIERARRFNPKAAKMAQVFELAD